MLTGDSQTTAQAVAKELGIDEIIAGVLPEQVKALQAEGRFVAMGTGTDVAMASAGVTLVKGDLKGIVLARRLRRASMRNIKQNQILPSATTAWAYPSPPRCSTPPSAC
ncbi:MULTISPECIES: hypothetical protein [Halomonadaceae]|uniref:Cu+-exporting ATPase n=1 Tax=Onishia taeanensis TaxID=284577 RepID=A0A328XKY2_9GAMM|nr:hypothetical protein [Halomonas sp. I5-271120]RAR57074.1 Cu+-exporting ATPase [Halomonas taeanensis]|tara:strand:+ start:1213 stop:1539 length:327 start_codon:yes stop_codon:yes gene_type:complete